MKSHTSLVAQQTRLREWAELVRDCQNRPQGMKIDEWCQLHDITKASYYWRLRKVREAFLATADNTPDFIEVPASAIQSENIAPDYKTVAMIRGRNYLTLEITDQVNISRLGRCRYSFGLHQFAHRIHFDMNSWLESTCTQKGST